ncbi:hypothetical protein PHLCEN_2v1417, partial [Hermanssonia centrifuga]
TIRERNGFSHEVFPKWFKLPITIYSNNQGAIALSKDDRFHTRTKHIDIRFHFVRQYVEDGTLSITYLPTDRMLADALTKALAGPQLTKLAAYISISPRRIMCGIAFTALVIFIITTLIGMHVYVVTQFIAIMNRLVQDGNARHNEDYRWSTTTNNNNAGGWGDSSAGWGTTNNDGWGTTNDKN